MAVGSTQPLTEMSTRNISWGGKGGRCVGLTTLPASCADCHEIWEHQPPGTLRTCPGLYRDCFYTWRTDFYGPATATLAKIDRAYLESGTAVAQWLRCCATNWKVAGSIPDGVNRIFYWHNPSDLTMDLGMTQPLTEMSTVPGSFPGGKGGRCVSLSTLPPSCAVVMKSGNLNFQEPFGPLQACNRPPLPLSLNNFN